MADSAGADRSEPGVVAGQASVFAGLLGGSRVPFHAAREGLFFGVFGRLHPKHDFPHISLLVMGLITAAGSFFALTTVIAGWLYVYASATVTALVWSTVWLAAGAVAYLGWARYRHNWPFGEKGIHEEFLQAQRGHPERVASPDAGGEASWA